MTYESIPNRVISTLLDVHRLLSHFSEEGLFAESTMHPDFINKVCDAVARHLRESANA